VTDIPDRATTCGRIWAHSVPTPGSGSLASPVASTAARAVVRPEVATDAEGRFRTAADWACATDTRSFTVWPRYWMPRRSARTDASDVPELSHTAADAPTAGTTAATARAMAAIRRPRRLAATLPIP